MKWNQQTIFAWGLSTFGRTTRNTLGMAIRMGKEAAELCSALTNEADLEEEVRVEAADVMIVLFQVCEGMKFDLDKEMTNHLYTPQIKEADDRIQDDHDCASFIMEKTIDLITALHHTNHNVAKRHAVSLGAAVAAVEDLYGYNVLEYIQSKMEINEKRQWAKTQDGSFQHV